MTHARVVAPLATGGWSRAARRPPDCPRPLAPHRVPGSGAAARNRSTYSSPSTPPLGRDDRRPTMYGVFFEDINRAADGGLYAELVQNRSFEYSTADNAHATPALTSWTARPAAARTGRRERRRPAERAQPQLPAALRRPASSRHATPVTTPVSRVEAGKTYDFSVWAAPPRRTALTVTLAAGRRRHAGRRPAGRPSTAAAGRKYKVALHRDRAPRLRTARLAVRRRRHAAASTRCRCFPRDTYRQRPTGCARTSPRRSPRCTRASCASPAAAWSTPAVHAGLPRPPATAPRTYQWKDTIGPVEQRADQLGTSGATTSPTASATTSTSSSPRTSAPMPLPVVPALRHRLRPEPAPPSTTRCSSGTSRTRSTSSSSPTARSTSDWGAQARRDGPPGALRPHRTSRSATRRTCPTSSSPASRSSATRSRRSTRTSRSSPTPARTTPGRPSTRLWQLNRDARRGHGRRALLQQPGLVPAEQQPLRLLRPAGPEGLPRRVRLARQQAAQRARRGRLHDRPGAQRRRRRSWRPTPRCSPTRTTCSGRRT